MRPKKCCTIAIKNKNKQAMHIALKDGNKVIRMDRMPSSRERTPTEKTLIVRAPIVGKDDY